MTRGTGGLSVVFVHICHNNPIARRAHLLAGEGRRVEWTQCLDECPACGRVPFAFVQGELVRAPSCEALADKVAARVARLRSGVSGGTTAVRKD